MARSRAIAMRDYQAAYRRRQAKIRRPVKRQVEAAALEAILDIIGDDDLPQKTRDAMEYRLGTKLVEAGFDRKQSLIRIGQLIDKATRLEAELENAS